MASYRYRCEIPAKNLGAMINRLDSKVLIFAKPFPGDELLANQFKGCVIVDICDDYLETPLYREILNRADQVVCTTEVLKAKLPHAEVIKDTYEFDEIPPHCEGDRVLWFGHSVNIHTLEPYRGMMNLTIVSNAKGPGIVPWSLDRNRQELDRADICIFPRTADYKSPNRVLEAIRRGCFVVAEPHPSLDDLPVYKGDIKEGIQWAIQNPREANSITQKAQAYINRYSPRTQADAWRKLLARLGYILEAESSGGRAGSTSIYQTQPTLGPI